MKTIRAEALARMNLFTGIFLFDTKELFRREHQFLFLQFNISLPVHLVWKNIPLRLAQFVTTLILRFISPFKNRKKKQKGWSKIKWNVLWLVSWLKRGFDQISKDKGERSKSEAKSNLFDGWIVSYHEPLMNIISN